MKSNGLKLYQQNYNDIKKMTVRLDLEAKLEELRKYPEMFSDKEKNLLQAKAIRFGVSI